jgi:hypothetical protein
MNRKRWALLVIIALMVFGYIKLFYKTYSVNAVAKTADCIVALDVKRITNTLLWQIISTPGQWKKVSFSSGNKDEISWKDMVKIPDYVLAFHVKGQPECIWYCVLEIKDDFDKGLQHYHFERKNANEFASNDLGIRFFKQADKILITNADAENSNYLEGVANTLFIQKEYIPKQSLQKVIDAKSHLAIYLAPGNFLQDAAVISGNFDKTKIEIKTTLTPKKQFSFTENNFGYSDSSLCALGFTQPSNAVYDLLSDSSKENISKALNCNIDSLLLSSNKYYQLDLTAIKERVDSAITYSYDDDFNKVEKAVVNTVQEPAYNFQISGDSVSSVYHYFLNSSKIEQTGNGQYFTPMPFVKSYCTVKNNEQLNITAANYFPAAIDKNTTTVLFLNLLLPKIPKELLNYLPGVLMQAIGNIESIQLAVHKQNGQLEINCLFNKKENDRPLISW